MSESTSINGAASLPEAPPPANPALDALAPLRFPSGPVSPKDALLIVLMERCNIILKTAAAIERIARTLDGEPRRQLLALAWAMHQRNVEALAVLDTPEPPHGP